MAGKANPFSLIQLQEKALHRMHEPRSSESRAARNRAASLRQYRKSVERLGFSAMQIQAQMRDILDVWKLQRDAEEVIDDKAPILADCERAAINALDPSLTPLCVSFVGMQETPSRSFGLYNIEEAIDDNLVLHSTVSLQTIAAYGYRPVMV